MSHIPAQKRSQATSDMLCIRAEASRRCLGILGSCSLFLLPLIALLTCFPNAISIVRIGVYLSGLVTRLSDHTFTLRQDKVCPRGLYWQYTTHHQKNYLLSRVKA